ncbi:ferric reductase-like transmembrane domain-containing protein [Mycoplasmatota bacterium WC30]
MITLPFIAITILVSNYFSKFIRKNSKIIYIVFAALSIAAFFLKKIPVSIPFNKGFLGLAFFYVVMVVGVLDKKKGLYKKLYSVRAELSIIGFIVLSPHAIFFFIDKFINLENLMLIELLGLVAYVIMIPLFITSFKWIRKKFTFLSWKKLQNLAYFVYVIIFVHLLLAASLPINKVLYLILFIPYLIYKPIHYFKDEKGFYSKMKDLDKKKEK